MGLLGQIRFFQKKHRYQQYNRQHHTDIRSFDASLEARYGKNVSIEKNVTISADVSIGKYTYADIAAELEKPGRDPRDEVAAPVLRSDVLEMSDLRPGMELKGTVRNIVDFGAFVDIGVHQDGLVHISELADRFVKHPLDVVKVGDIVNVKVLSVDEKRGKISLSMRQISTTQKNRSGSMQQKENRSV